MRILTSLWNYDGGSMWICDTSCGTKALKA